MTTLFGIANCDTIRKTRKWLDQQDSDYEFHDYKKLGCSAELARTLVRELGTEQVINKRGTTWRKLAESEREPLDDKKAISLIQQHPSLIKRPILCVDGEWLVGYDTGRMSDLINQGK